MASFTRIQLIDRFDRWCRAHSISLTIQRRVILETLIDSDDHPTVVDVFQRAAERAPGISQTTVYRTLELLEEAGVAARVGHPSSVARYEALTSVHDHLRCIRCGRIVDIEGPRARVPALDERRAMGFDVRAHALIYEGVCAECGTEPVPTPPKGRDA